ncbi:MAG: ABC transporter substrate-binding protein, partial [Anaerolineaceae bacterium]
MSPPAITRRHALLGGAAATTTVLAGAVGVALYRTGGSKQRTTSDPAHSSPTPSTSPPLTQTPTPPPRGGIARIPSPGRFNFDTFDVQRTGEPSVLEVLGRTHSRLIDWGDSPDPQLVPGLAARWEQPEAGTLTFHLDPKARWDERAPTNGRALTADDVRAHFTRQLELAKGTLPVGQRPADFAKLHIASTGILTVMVRTEDDPWALNTFASRYALIQAAETSDALRAAGGPSAGQVRGSGAFRFTDRGSDGRLTFESVRGGHLEPNLEGLEVLESGSPDTMLDLRIDECLARDRRDAATLRADGRMRELTRYEDSPIISTYFAGAPPWNNPTLVQAISGALNRFWLSAALFGGRADPCGPISPASGAFAPPQRQLERFAGFGADAELEARAAHAAWSVAGGPALGTVTIDFPSIFDPLYSASSVVVGRLNEVLGPQFKT